MSAQEDAVIEAARMAAGEQAVVDWLARCVDQHRNDGDIIEAAMALGVKALIERLRKERDDAIKAMDKGRDEVIEECAKVVEAQYQTGDHELGHFLNAAAAKIRALTHRGE